MLFYIRLLFLWGTFFIFYCIDCYHAEQQNRAYVTVLENGVVDHVMLRALLPDTFFLSMIQIESDVACDKEELCYLMNIRAQEMVTREAVLSGMEQCAKKDRFFSIEIDPVTSQTGIDLFVRVIGKYLIKQIKIGGIWHDVDSYKRLYQCQKFEPFEAEKHKQGLSAIQSHLHSIGYCDALVQDEIIYDHGQKYVTIVLHINLKKRFIIDSIQLCLDQLFDEHKVLISELFNVYCASKLFHQEHAHERMNKALSLFMEQLCLKGFLCSKVLCEEIVQKEQHAVSLRISLESAYQNRILFQGNDFFSTKQLFEHIRTVFKNERCITADIVREELLSLYMSHGFLHVSILQNNSDFETRYDIIERNQPVVSNVFFSWMNTLDGCKTKYQDFVLQRLVGRFVDEHTITKTLERCINELISDGFLGAKLVEYRYEAQKDDTVVVHISIDGGKQIYVDDIVVKLDQDVIDIPSIFFRPEKRTLVHVSMLAKQREQILFILHNAGYLHTVVHPEVRLQGDKTLLLWQVTTGKQVHFGKLIILGNPIVSFSQILKNITFQTGTLWQQNLIQQSLENLQKLSMYEHIELYPELYTMNENRELFLRLVPDDPFEVRLRVGTELQYIQDYQSFGGITYKMGGSFIAKNRLKCADVLQFDADFAGSHREIVLSYNIPVVLPKHIQSPFSQIWSVKLQGYHMRYDQPGVIGYPKNIYTVGRDGFLCALCATKNSSYMNMSCGFEAQKTTIKNRKYADAIAVLINFDQHLLGKEIPYLFFETNCLFDFLDEKIYPTRGTSSLFSLKFMMPFHDKTRYFAKLLCEQTFFVPLYTCVLGLRFRLGYLFHKDFPKISPMERFYLGGSHSVRGYEADLFPPTSPLIDDSGKVVHIPRGGKIMANINTELRKTIISYVTCALFHDIGALADNIETVHAMLPLHTSGFGVRFDTPFGPLRFDIGWKWKLTHKDERRYAWYLSFGRSF